MEPTGRAAAQQRSDEIRIFAAELERLAAERVLALSEEQRRAVAEHHAKLLAEFTRAYDIDRDAKAKQLSWGMRIASLLGALALAASVYYLYIQYWGLLGTASQVALLVTLSFASLGATALLQRRGGAGYYTRLAASVALACFVLNVSMLGQIFAITETPRAFVAWCAFAAAIAYAVGSPLLLIAACGCGIFYLSATVGQIGGAYWGEFGSRPENLFPAGILLLLVPMAAPRTGPASFPAIYRLMGLLTLFVAIVWLGSSGTSSYLRWDRDVIEGTYQILGFVGSAAVTWIGVRRHWPHLVNSGVAMFVILLGIKFVDWWWESMPRSLFFLIVGLTAVLLLSVFNRLRAMPGAPPAEPAP